MQVIGYNEVLVVDGFVSALSCKRILQHEQEGCWTNSEVQAQWSQRGSIHSGRTSQSLAWPLYSEFTQTCLLAWEYQLAQQFGIKSTHLEPWQMTRYRRGQSYDYHVDCGAWARHPAGERLHTIMVVIEAPSAGGATHFRALNKAIRPVLGRLVVWCNLLPSGGCNHGMIHSGRPVWRGQKAILTTWEHTHPFVPHDRRNSSASK